MKTKIISIVCMFSGIYAVVGQAEYDDMYFTSKDRAAQTLVARVDKPQSSLNSLGETSAAYQAVSPNISLQGYTGRTINPDYQPGAVAVVTSSYFKPNYQPTRVNSSLYAGNNNNYYSNYNNFSSFYSPYSMYGSRFGYGGYYSPYSYGYNNFGYSPYSYGGYYDPYYSNFGYSPYGYGNSMSMYYSMAYGFGGGYYGYGFPSYYGYGSCYGYYPSTVVVVNAPDNHVNSTYGKRQTRSSYVNNTASSYGARGGMISSVDPNQNRGGRVASTSNSNTYYQRGWRQDPAVTQSTNSSAASGSRYAGYGNTNSGSNSRSGWSSFGNSNSSNTRSSWGNSNNTSFGNSTHGSMNTGSSFGGGRSTGSSFGGGGSVGGSRPSGGGSAGGSRGRGN